MQYYLTFMIADVSFAVPVDEVQEIARPKSMRKKKKNTVKHMLGYFTLRGVVIPLFDLSAHLSFKTSENQEVIIIKRQDVMIGVKVDEVLGIVAARDVTPYPDLVPTRNFLIGIIPDEKPLLQVISLMKIFTTQRVKTIKDSLDRQVV
jgi:chemotaxis signal transduction protein